MVVLKDKISVLGPVVGLEGVVLAKDYTSTIFTDLTDCIKNGRLPQVNIYLTLFIVFFSMLINLMNMHLLIADYTSANIVCCNVLPRRI